MRSKIVVVVLVIAVIVVIGVGVGLLAGHGPAHGPSEPVPVSDNSAPHTPATHDHASPTPQNPAPDVTPVVATQSIAGFQTNILVPVNKNGSDTNWEEQIDDIVGSDEPDTNKVHQLFALFPKLPPDGQEEAAQHLSNLVDDEDYAPLGELLKNDKLPEGVLDELLADVLNRPNNLKLPALLQVASDANHVKHDEAKDLLELYLGEDYGTDWNSWGQHMTNLMQQNPD